MRGDSPPNLSNTNEKEQEKKNTINTARKKSFFPTKEDFLKNILFYLFNVLFLGACVLGGFNYIIDNYVSNPKTEIIIRVYVKNEQKQGIENATISFKDLSGKFITNEKGIASCTLHVRKSVREIVVTCTSDKYDMMDKNVDVKPDETKYYVTTFPLNKLGFYKEYIPRNESFELSSIN